MRLPGDGQFDTPYTDHVKEDVKYCRAIDILVSKASKDKDPLTRKHALYLLSMTGDLQFVDIFTNSLHDPEKAVRSQAAQALVQIGTPVFEKVVILLTDSDWRVRYRAAEILGMIKNRDAVKPLIQALTDEKDHVRYMAAKGLWLIKDPEALAPLRNCLNDENPYVRTMVKRAIAAIEE